MGIAIGRSSFTDAEYEHAAQRLRGNLRALERLLKRPGFGRGEASLGAELEMSVIDESAQALPVNEAILDRSGDPNLQLELDRFNLEYNLSPVMARGRPFAAIRAEMTAALQSLRALAAEQGGRIVTTGILPTLRADQVSRRALTDLPRFHALANGIARLRDTDIRLRIDGREPLAITCDSVAVEGANTSFQIHLRVEPERFADLYNAAQLATPLALATGANSPILLGHELWDETRVALFKQSVDTRGADNHEWRRAARVPFGHGWVRHGAYELFAEACHLYPILIPLCSDEQPEDVVDGGGVPELLELRLQQGTIWRWNRAVYDPAGGGHLRIELRALPAGPTPLDMMANAAFLVGLTIGLAEDINRLLPAFPARYAEYNFYRAAQRGLDAELLWPDTGGPSPRALGAVALCRELLPLAERGLGQLGVDAEESTVLLGLIRDRIDARRTPARWQRDMLHALDRGDRAAALEELVECYVALADTGRPVSEW